MTEKNDESKDFGIIVSDFIRDIKLTFPEYVPLIEKWWCDKSSFFNISDEEERETAFNKSTTENTQKLLDFCKQKYPPRFFDILNQNEDIFKDNSTVDTEFLPNIHFKNLWQFKITDNTRTTIWKYLQLVLFSIVSTIDNKDMFGDTAKLFENVDNDEFKTKLEETMSAMQGLFENMSSKSNTTDNNQDNNQDNNINLEDLPIPNASQLHDHISGILDGKLGKLAREIAEETAGSLNIDMENTTDIKDVLNNLMKNPTKLMSLVKNVGVKLDAKIQSGEIKESELLTEANDIMNKMKDMPGMGDIQSLLSKMGMGGKGKVNVGAMEGMLNKNLKAAKMKERMKATMQKNIIAKEMMEKIKQEHLNKQHLAKPSITDDDLISIFTTGDKVEKTPRGSTNNTNNDTNNKKKKKKRN